MKRVKKNSKTESRAHFNSIGIRQLSERDSLLMAEMLINPPEPNEKLKALFANEKSKKSPQK